MMYKKVRAACMIIGASSVALLIWFFGMQLVRFFSLETLQCYAGYFIEFSRNHYTTSILVYLLVGIISILFFLPVVTLYMVAAGFFFGPWEGAFYAIIGSTIGACCAFMFVRTTAGPWVHTYEKRLVTINHFIRAYGFYALILLRISHLIPFFLLNIAASLMPISLRSFFFATLVGVIPGALLFAWTGQYLCTINSVWDLVNVNILLIGLCIVTVLVGIVTLVSVLKRRHA